VYGAEVSLTFPLTARELQDKMTSLVWTCGKMRKAGASSCLGSYSNVGFKSLLFAAAEKSVDWDGAKVLSFFDPVKREAPNQVASLVWTSAKMRRI
jgi:hypothetical protein